MPHTLISGRFLHDADFTATHRGGFLICPRAEWEDANLSSGETVEVDTPHQRGRKLVIGEVLEWPAGESWVYVLFEHLPATLPSKKPQIWIKGKGRKQGVT